MLVMNKGNIDITLIQNHEKIIEKEWTKVELTTSEEAMTNMRKCVMTYHILQSSAKNIGIPPEEVKKVPRN